MPNGNYKSITVTGETYEHFWGLFMERKEELAEKGIRSFSAYITHILYQRKYP